MKAAYLLPLLIVAAPADSKTTFAAYEGPAAETTGPGGTKVDMRGLDLWTTGGPPRRFRVLGVIDDERTDKPLDGDPMNSPKVAKLARQAGGDALILLGQDSRQIGAVATGSSWAGGASAFGTFQGRAVNHRSTRFAVIKYLP